MVTSYLGSLRAFSCSKHMPKSILRFAIQPRATFLASSRPSGSYPETGLEEINGDLREADFWSASLKVYSGA
jgi:hypothetical protein